MTLISIALIAMIGTIVALQGKRRLEKRGVQMLKVAYPLHDSARSIDPSRVDTIAQANLIWNLYSTLVEFSPTGQIVAGIAEVFDWKGNEIHFTIRKGLRTTDGWPITAEDAVFTLKRLITKSTNTHGDLKTFLCPGFELRSVEDNCPGIRAEGNSLILTPAQPYLGKFLIPLLASVDFSIIPKRSVRNNDPSCEIIDYRNTSGAYFLEKDNSSGALLLKANPNHYHYSESIAQVIQLVPAKGDESIEKFKRNEVDFITTADTALGSSLLDLEKDHSAPFVHKSMNIKTWVLQFTRGGQKRLSKQQRIFLGKQIRQRYLKSIAIEGLNPTIEFFPTFGEASLDADQLASLKRVFDSVERVSFDRKVVLGVAPPRLAVFQKALEDVAEIEVKAIATPPWLFAEHEQPDMYVANVDGAFFEDISMITYNSDLGTFGLTRQEGIHWLDDYMKIEDRMERLKRLRALHLKFLSEATVVPLGNAPYVAIARAPWKIGFSQFYADSPLWQVTKN